MRLYFIRIYLAYQNIITMENSEGKSLNIDDIINNCTKYHNNKRILLK